MVGTGSIPVTDSAVPESLDRSIGSDQGVEDVGQGLRAIGALSTVHRTPSARRVKCDHFWFFV